MGRRIALLVGCLLVVVGTATAPTASAAGPPRPGTTDSGLNETEEATLWSKVPSDYWTARPGEDTTVHELATGTELTFTEPPGLAGRWNRYAYEQYRPGGTDVSVHPEGAYTHSYSYIEDAHATIFSMEPSTRTYVESDDERLYVAPEGTLRGVVDYRVDVPEDSESGGGSTTYRLVDHGIDEVRFYVDSEVVDTAAGTHRPTFEYDLDFDAESLKLEARIDATVKKTVRPPPDSDRPTRTYTYDVWIKVWNDYEIEVYDVEAGVDRVRYPDGDEGVAITQAQPWQGYTLDSAGDAEIRGIWRFFLARRPGWGWLVESTDGGTSPRESHALPVSVNAYPSAMAPRAKPEGGEPTILRTWGPTRETPKPELPGTVAVEVVEANYTETYGLAVRTDGIDPEDVTVHGIVDGVDAGARTLFEEPRRIRETELSAQIVEETDSEATVRLRLADADTGEPIDLEAEGASTFSNARSGYLEIDGRRVRTDEAGEATVRLTDPGVYGARYEPTHWLDAPTAYAGATATVWWHPLASPSNWFGFVVRVGVVFLPFAFAWYAGKRLGRLVRFGGPRRRE